MFTFIRNIIQLLILPDSGWDDISCNGRQNHALSGMIGMIVISSFSVLVKLLYLTGSNVIMILQQLIIIAITYVATYFVADFLINLFLPRINDGVIDRRRVKLMILYAISLLTIQTILSMLLPISFAILELWPIYVIIILWRAMKMLDIGTEKTGKYLALIIVAFIVPSQLVMRVFNSILQ